MISRASKDAQLALCAISGFGRCSQRAGAEIGAGPDLYTACKVVNSHPVIRANLQNLYVQALLAKYNMDGNALLAKLRSIYIPLRLLFTITITKRNIRYG